jgi:hypothetical protein
MKNLSFLTAAATMAASVALLAGCTSTVTADSSATQGPSQPSTVNTPATKQDAEAAAKNDNKCVNDVAWMTFDDGRPASRTLGGSCESVIVFGNAGQLTVAKAGSLTVMGDNNKVTIDSVSKIDFEGKNNVVTYSGAKPEILQSGEGNTLAVR